MTAMPVMPLPRVSSRNGAPNTAPMATASADGACVTSATTGTTVSGSDVPSAASRLPVAPLARRMRNPAHSTALVNSSDATIRISALAANSRAVLIAPAVCPPT